MQRLLFGLICRLRVRAVKCAVGCIPYDRNNPDRETTQNHKSYDNPYGRYPQTDTIKSKFKGIVHKSIHRIALVPVIIAQTTWIQPQGMVSD
jgi:hypothetical protein